MKKEILILFAALLALCGSAQTKKLSSGGLKGTRLASKQNSVSKGNRLSSAGSKEFEGEREKNINGNKYT